MKALREQISLNIIKCRDLIEEINEFNPDKSKELNNKLEQLLNKFEEDSKEHDAILSLKTSDNLEIHLILDIEELISNYSYLYDLEEINKYFNEQNILSGEYDEVVSNYNNMVEKLERISNKIGVSELSKFVNKKYEFLYKILCRAVYEKEKFPVLDAIDIERIKALLEKEMKKVNPSFSMVDIDDISEYIKYLNETKNNESFIKKLKNVVVKVKERKPKLSQKSFDRLVHKNKWLYNEDNELNDCFVKYDLSNVDFDGVNIINKNLEGTGAKIDPQKVYRKDLSGANLKGLDLSEANFNFVKIVGTNLEGTGAKIYPQLILAKNLGFANLKGLDLSQADFDSVIIRGTNLEGTGAKIDPQKISNKDLSYANLKGLDLSQADFDDVKIEGANLEGTGARLIIDGKEVVFERFDSTLEEVEEVKKR